MLKWSVLCIQPTEQLEKFFCCLSVSLQTLRYVCLQALTLHWGLPQHFLQHAAKGERWQLLLRAYGFIYNVFHNCDNHKQGLLVYYTPTRSLCKQAKTYDVCTYVFFKGGEETCMEVSGTLFYQTEDITSLR